MKSKIHPKWFDAQITCACGNTFTVGSTHQTIAVEVCDNCHPFYTGQMKYLDTAGRVDAFRAKLRASGGKVNVSKTEKRALKKMKKLAEETSRPETLSQLREINQK